MSMRIETWAWYSGTALYKYAAAASHDRQEHRDGQPSPAIQHSQVIDDQYSGVGGLAGADWKD